jgi:hypothetical protein
MPTLINNNLFKNNIVDIEGLGLLLEIHQELKEINKQVNNCNKSILYYLLI